jgi:hypothetical protein
MLGGIGRDDVLGPAGRADSLLSFLEAEFDFGSREARQLDLEVEIDQGLQLDREDLAVPAGFLGRTVVGRVPCHRAANRDRARRDRAQDCVVGLAGLERDYVTR